MNDGGAEPTTAVATAATALAELSAAGIDVDTSTRRRAEYSFDASNYRLPPLGVVFPRSVDEVVRTVRVCAEHGVAVTSRGGGTSLAGNAIGRGLVLDFSRHMNGVASVDESARTAHVQPGIVLTELQRHVQGATDGRLTFAPDPSSKSRATVGGAIGNDACGNHSVRYGRTSDHVVALDVVTAAGHRLTATPDGVRATDPDDAPAVAAAARIAADLHALADDHLADFRLELARFLARSPATTWRICCPSTGSTWHAHWSAARARARSSSGRRCHSCRWRRRPCCCAWAMQTSWTPPGTTRCSCATPRRDRGHRLADRRHHAPSART